MGPHLGPESLPCEWSILFVGKFWLPLPLNFHLLFFIYSHFLMINIILSYKLSFLFTLFRSFSFALTPFHTLILIILSFFHFIPSHCISFLLTSLYFFPFHTENWPTKRPIKTKSHSLEARAMIQRGY